MTIPDPTTEIKAIRHRLGAEFDYDLDRIFADIQRRQSKSGRTYVTMPPRRIADKSGKGHRCTPPTEVQTFSISVLVEKKGEVDSVGNSDLIGSDFNVIDGGAEDLPSRCPVRAVKATFDLCCE